MSENMSLWNAVKTPPDWALKKINGGRLNGMTDISPMWRIGKLTELYGPCGTGWYYDIVKLWSEQQGEQAAAFAQIALYVKDGDKWSQAIPGLGGSMLAAKQSSGLHVSDEAYKMAVTDALSVALKQLGFGATVYMGMMDTKYQGAK